MKKNKNTRNLKIFLSIFISFWIFSGNVLLFARAKNIIVMIGDGMGPAVIGLTKYYSRYVEETPFLNIERVADDSSIAILYTLSGSNLVTDSAAAATSLFCGIKTVNGRVGVDENNKPAENVLEKAQLLGKSVGIVTTTDVTDATPAGFSVHTLSRQNKQKIANQQIEKKINIIFGGGRNNFNIQKAKGLGYNVVFSREELLKIDSKNSDFVLGLFSELDLSFAGRRKKQEPSLMEMTKTALEILSKNKDGFLLLIEGGRIDHACHENNPENLIKDMIEFDQTVGVVKDFIETKKIKEETLLLITADHDTGGVALGKINGEYATVDDLKELKGIFWASKDHTACPVILIGTGPGSDKIKGFKDNTFIYELISSAIQ